MNETSFKAVLLQTSFKAVLLQTTGSAMEVPERHQVDRRGSKTTGGLQERCMGIANTLNAKYMGIRR
jgi:hypothetical protein